MSTRHVEPQRLTLAQLLRATGAFSEGEAVALGRALCRAARLEPDPRRLRLLCTTNLFFTREGQLGCAAAEDERTDVSDERTAGRGRCVAVSETVARGPTRLGEERRATTMGRGAHGSPGWKR